MIKLLSTNIKNKSTHVFTWLVILSFLLFIITMLYYNGLCTDDNLECVFLRNHTIFESIKHHYLYWMGNYSAFFIQGIEYKLTLITGSTFIPTFIILIIEVLLIQDSLSLITGKSRFQCLIFSLILYNILIFTMYSITSYFWICASQYFLSNIIVFHVATILLKKKHLKPIQFVFLYIQIFFITSVYVILASIFMLYFTLFVFYKVYKTNEHKIGYIFLYLFAFLTFAIYIIAPGNYVRMDFQHIGRATDIIQFSHIFGKSIYSIYKSVLLKFTYYLLFGGVLLYILPTHNRAVSWKKLQISLVIYFLTVLLSTALYVYAVGTSQAGRALNHIVLFNYIIFGIFIYECKPFITLWKIKHIYILVLIILSCSNFYTYIRTEPEVKKYRLEMNKREQFLLTLETNKNKKLVILEPIKWPIFYSFNDVFVIFGKHHKAIFNPNFLTPNPDSYNNVIIQRYLNLSYKICIMNDDERLFKTK